MVVITILGLLATAVTVSLIDRLHEAQRKRVELDFHTILDACRTYELRHGHPPDAAGGLAALVQDHVLPAVPVDPWGAPYHYERVEGQPRLTSLGADGQPGGTGNDADLTSDPAPAPPGG